jgi:HSP20 family protein
MPKGKENQKEGQQGQNEKPAQTKQPESGPNSGQIGGQSAGAITRRDSSDPSLWTASPFSFMRRFSEEMDRLFEDFGFGTNRLSQGFSGFGRGLSGLWSPAIEMFERGDKLVVRADLPGMKKDDVKVEILDGSLTIAGERKQEHKEGNGGKYRTERSYGSFYRAIPLPEGVDTEKANATFRDGVLEIELDAPPPPRSRSRQVQIQS